MPTRLDPSAFDANSNDFDAIVEAEPEIDGFCSSSAWILPFHNAFAPDRELHIYRSDRAFVALAARIDARIGVVLEPLETMWQYPCPLVGEGGAELLAQAQELIAAPLGLRNLPLILSGIPLSGEIPASLGTALHGRHELRVVDSTVRIVASLEGGFDGWLARRSSSVRRNLRAALRRAANAGVEYEHVQVHDAEAARELYTRILSLEGRSWKSRTGEGVDQGPMRAFYQDMLPRLAERGRLQVLFARLEGRDVGYLHGGILERHFRGLQMSFDDGEARLSIGNLLQCEMIRMLCERGFETYDLGSQPGYKERWAEPGLTTVTLVCRPRR